MIETIERFSNRVTNYIKYRPNYPAAAIDLFEREMHLSRDSAIVDLGSGTGISAQLFLEFGCTVYGVEPNAGMRQAAETYLRKFEKFVSVSGTAEQTTLADGMADLVIAAQAFHWFNPDETRAEIQRICKAGAYAALIWNERQLDTTPFLRDYEALLQKFANDYDAVRHDTIGTEQLSDFFGRDVKRAVFENRQVFDFDGLLGRLLSSSYMPAPDDPRIGELTDELYAVFAKHAESDKITVFYDTNIYYAAI